MCLHSTTAVLARRVCMLFCPVTPCGCMQPAPAKNGMCHGATAMWQIAAWHNWKGVVRYTVTSAQGNISIESLELHCDTKTHDCWICRCLYTSIWGCRQSSALQAVLPDLQRCMAGQHLSLQGATFGLVCDAACCQNQRHSPRQTGLLA